MPDENGIYPRYRVPNANRPAAAPEVGFGWAELLEHWDAAITDLAQFYGVIFYTTDLPWPAIETLTRGLFNIRESRLYGLAFPPNP